MPGKDKMQLSDLSDLDEDPVCQMDPMTRRGRISQLLGMVCLPLIPGITLVIYSLVRLQYAVNDYKAAQQVAAALDKASPIWDVLFLILEEMDGVVSNIAGNGTEILGSMNEFFASTNAAIDKSGYNFLNFRQDLDHRRNILVAYVTNASIESEVKFYSKISRSIENYIETSMDVELKLVLWPNLVSYTNLLVTLLSLGAERALGMVYFILGQLTDSEYKLYSEALEVGQDHIKAAIAYSPIVEEQYNLMYLSNTYLNNWVEKRRSVILENLPMKEDLFGSVIWYRKLTSLMNVIREIERDLAADSVAKLKQGQIVNIEEMTFYTVLTVLVIFLASPFLFLSAYKTVESLFHYAYASEKRNVELRREKRRTEKLLNEMLPRAVAYRMRKGEKIEAETYECVTVFFSDISDFTEISMESDPIDIVLFLNEIYQFIDVQIEMYDIYKVETISATYMVVSGLPSRNGDRHSMEIARFSLDLMQKTQDFVIPHMPDRVLQLRVGVHTGPVVAGVVGNKMLRYCLFGDTVNTASRMQSSGLPQKIHMSQASKKHLTEYGGFVIESRGTIEIKGKGAMTTYWLEGRVEKSVTSVKPLTR